MTKRFNSSKIKMADAAVAIRIFFFGNSNLNLASVFYKIEFFTAFYVNFNSADGFKDQFVEFKQLQSAVEECVVVHLGQCVQTISHGCRSFRLQVDSPTLSCLKNEEYTVHCGLSCF